MIEMYKGYIESRDKCLTVQGFFLMIIIQWSTGLSTLLTKEIPVWKTM